MRASSFNEDAGQTRSVSPERPERSLADLQWLDIRDVAQLMCVSRSWIFDKVRKTEFPAPLRLGAKCSRWRLSDVRTYMERQESTGRVHVRLERERLPSWLVAPPAIRPRRRFEE
jgi:prophage regulatory protein